MTTIRKTILAAAVIAVTSPFAAHSASHLLPERGPIPQERPTAQAEQVEIIRRDVVAISTEEQEIPQVRRDVRVVGARFLPAANEEFDIRQPVEQASTALGFAEWVVATTMERLFETEDGDVQVAAVSQ